MMNAVKYKQWSEGVFISRHEIWWVIQQKV